mgnify:FL=1
MERKGYVYILTNCTHSVLYIGVTSNLQRRIYQHRMHLMDGFTDQYNVVILVYYECYESIREAITREKQLKAGSRIRKETLINEKNRSWQDLYAEVMR